MKSFRAFRLDTVNHCVWCGQERLSLAPKAFDVLRYLVEHADRLVTQEEILEALWPETYVNPEVVKKYILGIRKVLGDQSASPAFIATFPRRGYQFIAPITEERSAPATQAAAGKSATLVGRTAAIAQLEKAVDEARRGRRQIVFVTGEAGVGKTTLVDVFLQNGALGGDARIARGQCVEGFGGKEAYYPILDALGQMLQGSDDDPIFQAFLKRAPTWLVQFPSLIDSQQRHALEKEIIGATRERMVREVCEALESVAAQDLVVLCVEDLHWVDPSTLDFISALARRRGPAKLLLLGTYRPADVAVSHGPLKALKQDLVIHGLATELCLERLEESDVAEYLRIEFAGAEFPAGFANAVYRHSGGNALFMVTILKDMRKKGLIRQSGGSWFTSDSLEEDVSLDIPETLDQLIDLAFQQLDPLEQRILRSASVAGEDFSAWAIAAAAELEQDAVEDICERLADRALFIKACGIHELESGQVSAHYEFLHSLYREVLYRRLSEVTRSKLHLHIARRLKAFCDPCEQEMATQLALHFEAGRDYEEAIRYLLVAAENAVGRFAYRDAIEILQEALDLVTRLPADAQPEHEVRIFEFIGDAHFALGAVPQSAEAYEEAAARAEQAGLKTAQVHALICAMYPLGFINPERGLAAMDRAVQMSAEVGDELLLARVQLLASSCRLVFDDWSSEHAERCAAAYRTLLRLGDAGSDPYQKMTYAHVLTLLGEYREALAIFEAAISRTDHGLRLIPHFGALSGKTIALLRMGRLGDVLRITQAGRALPDDNKARSWLLSFREAWIRLLAFDRAGALAICDEISRASAKYHSGQPRTISTIAAGYAALDRGEYANAIDLFTQVAAPPERTKFFLHWAWRMTAQLEIANALLLLGDTPKAREATGIFLSSALATLDPHLQALAWELDARVSLAERDLPRGRGSIERALAIIDKFEILTAAWQVYATAWDLHRHSGDRDAAESSRFRSETCIRQIADSFDPDEPLRTTFLQAAPVRRILSGAPAAQLVSKGGSRMAAR